MAEIGSKLIRVFSEEKRTSINKKETAGNIIDSILTGNAMDVQRIRKERPDEEFFIVVDGTGFFVGSEYTRYANCPSVKNNYRHNQWLNFCVGKIVDDGRIVFVKFVQPDVWHPSFHERRRRKKLLSSYDVTVVQSDGVISDGQERRYVEISDVTPEDVRWGDDDMEKVFDQRRAEMEKVVIGNFAQLPETGREIVGKSRDIIKNALMHDDSLATGYY